SVTSASAAGPCRPAPPGVSRGMPSTTASPPRNLPPPPSPRRPPPGPAAAPPRGDAGGGGAPRPGPGGPRGAAAAPRPGGRGRGLGGWVLRRLVPALHPLPAPPALPHLGGPLWAPRGLADWAAVPPHPFP